MKVYGGFAGTETLLTDRNLTGNKTILSGDIGAADNSGDNVYHVVTFTNVSNTTVLDGFTITRGNAIGGTAANLDQPRNAGGGIYNNGSGLGNSSNPQITNCIVTYNNSNYQGAGLHNEANVIETAATAGEASPTITNCTFSYNTTGLDGAGVNNEGEFGSKSSPLIVNCLFSHNTAGDDAGGLYSDAEEGTSSPTVTDCIFEYNAAKRGGAIKNDGTKGYSNGVFTNCKFIGNTATKDGGAVVNWADFGVVKPTFTNCTFSRNTCSHDGINSGGAMFNVAWPGESSPIIVDCLFNNNAGYQGAAIANRADNRYGGQGLASPQIRNTIFRANFADNQGGALHNYGIYGGECSPIVINCLITGNKAYQGAGAVNYDGVPQYINCTMTGNYNEYEQETFYVSPFQSALTCKPVLKNCIIWHNYGTAVSDFGVVYDVFHISYSNIEGTGGSGAGWTNRGSDKGHNIDLDPLFAQKIVPNDTTSAGDFRLTTLSPSIDAGNNSYISEPYDVRGAGFNRKLLKSNQLQTGQVDMGAYELQANADPAIPYPAVTTTPITNITDTGVTTGGEKINNYGQNLTEKGIVWSTSPNVDITKNKIVFPSKGATDYTVTVGSLPPYTNIYLRAFVTNSLGTGYGAELSFVTLMQVPLAPTVNTPTSNSLKVKLNADSNPGNLEYAIHETTKGKFVQANGSLGVSEVWQTLSAWGTVTVTGLTLGTSYTFEVKARNANLEETVYGPSASGSAATVPLMLSTALINSDLQAAGNTDKPWSALDMSPDGKYAILAANPGRLYFTSNSGTTWTEVQPIGGTDANWQSVAISNNGAVIYAAVKGGNVWRSSNSGASWSDARPSGYSESLNWQTVSCSGDGSIVIAAESNYSSYTPGLCYKSNNYGSSWTELSVKASYPVNSGTWSGSSVSSDGTIMALAENNGFIYRSSDSGSSWNYTTYMTSNSWRSVALSPDGSKLLANYYGSSSGKLRYWNGAIWTDAGISGKFGAMSLINDGSKRIAGFTEGRLYSFANNSWSEIKPAGDVNGNWTGAQISSDGSFIMVCNGGGRVYSIGSLSMSNIASTTATGNHTVVTMNDVNVTSRGTIIYPYADIDKVIGDAGVINVLLTGSFSYGQYANNITGLTPNTRYNARAVGANFAGNGYSTRVDFRTLAAIPGAPVLGNQTSATIDLTLDKNGNPDATEFVVLETTTSKYLQANGTLGAAPVWQSATLWGTKTVTGLTLNTTYTFKTKARNGDNVETDYGPSASWMTNNAPVVTTQDATNLATGTATGHGTISNTNGSNATTRGGIVYPYTNNDKIIGEAEVVNISESGSFGTGAYDFSLSGLSANNRYNVRAYAINPNGTAYAPRVDFWTLANVPSAPAVTNMTPNTMDVSVNANANPATTEFAILEATTNKFVQVDGSLRALAVWQIAANWGAKTVTGLSLGTTYSFKVKARNGSGIETDYSSPTLGKAVAAPSLATEQAISITTSSASLNCEITFTNGDNATTRGIIWYPYTNTDKSVTDAGVIKVSWNGNFGADLYSGSLTGLSVNTHYNARAYATSVNGTGYSPRIDFWTLANTPSAPTVNNASSGGMEVIINANGNPANTLYTVNETTTGRFVQADGTLGAGEVTFTQATFGTKTVTGLTYGTTYSFRVKATSGFGVVTGYSATASLTTLQTPAVSTGAMTDITVSSAKGNGNVTATNGGVITKRGLIIYLYDGSNKKLGNAGVTEHGETGSFGTGPFTASFTGLSSQKQYSVRAYATSSYGTDYGSREDFWATGIAPGNALDFDGINDYVNLGNTFSFPGTTPFTIEGWVNRKTTVGGTIFGKYNQSGDEYYLSVNTDGTVVFYRNQTITSTKTIPEGKWSHLAATYDGTTMKLYIDGELAGSTASGSITAITAIACVGARLNNDLPSSLFKGKIDEFRVWDNAKSQAELKASMFNEINTHMAGLISYYRFNSNSGTVLLDYAQGQNNGTLSGFALSGNSSNWIESYAMVVPTALNTTGLTDNSFTANWTPTITGVVEGYLLDIATDNLFTTFVSGFNAKNVGPASSFNVTGLTAHTTYYWRVRANKASVDGQGGYFGQMQTVLVPYESVRVTSGSNTNSFNLLTNAAIVADPNLTVNYAQNVPGFTVTISSGKQDGDVLSYTGTLPTGVTASAYNSTSGSIVFTGSATPANWQAFLQTVTFKAFKLGTGSRSIAFAAGSNLYNSHYYEYVSTSTDWKNAQTNAKARTFLNLPGYLATVSSQAENDFIKGLFSGSAWIGASDDYTVINSATGATTYANQAASEGKWYWASGPDAGTQFTSSNSPATPVAGLFNNWASGEPNNANNNEHYANMGSANGTWNDSPLSQTMGYIVEYGGYPDDYIPVPYALTMNVTSTEPGNAINLDGTNDYISIPDNNALDLITNYTIEAWIKPSAFTSLGGIVSKYQTGGANGYILRLTNNGASSSGITFDEMNTANGVLTTNTWYHIAAVNNAGTRTVYINGVNVPLTGTAMTVKANGDPIRIGSDFASRYFNGSIDEVRVWNKVRTQSEIQANMLAPVSPASTGLVAYFNFNQGIPGGNNSTGQSSVYDLSTTGIIATLNGFTLTNPTSSNYVESYAMVVPATIAATNKYSLGFTANWTPSVTGIAEKYLLDVSTSATFASYVSGYQGKDVGNVTSYGVGGLSANTTNYYRVRSEKAGAAVTTTGGYSNVTTVTTNGTETLVATLASNRTATSFTANWLAPALGNIANYLLDVSTDAGFGSFVAAYNNVSVNGLSKEVTGLSPNLTYYYRVKAASYTNSNTITVVNVPPFAAISTSATSVCVGATAPAITFTGSGSTPPYTFVYKLNNGTNQSLGSGASSTVTLNVPVDQAGTFSYTLVSVSDGTATNLQSGTAAVNVNALSTATFTSSPGAGICLGDDVTYTTQAGQSNYIWTLPGIVGTDYSISSGGTGSSSSSVTVKWLTQGSKTVTISYTNSNNCNSSVASNITMVNTIPVVAPITGASGATVGFTSTLSDAAAGGLWSSSDQNVAVVATNGVVTGIAQGTSTISYTVTSAGCSKSVSTLFTVEAAPVPTITGFSPSSGAPGATVTVSGTNFAGATSITVAGITASFTVVNATTINFVVPNGTGQGFISVTVPGGTATSVAKFTFNSAQTPVISSFSPTTANPGQTVIITGLQFANASAVSFGGTGAISFNVDSDTQITATVGSGTSGSLSVTTPGGTGSLAGFSLVVTCANPSSAGAIAAEQTIFAGNSPAALTSTSFPSGHTGTLEYKWQLSTTSSSSGFADIASSNSVGYAPGVLTETTWYRRLVRVACKSDWTSAAITSPVKVTVNIITWTGAVSTDWNTNGNWSNNLVPTASDNALIPDVTNDPIVNQPSGSPAVCKDITIQTGAVVTVASGKVLRVYGTITNNSGVPGLVIKSTSDVAGGTGSLINSTSGVLGTVERYVSGDYWHLISPASTGGETLANFVGVTQNDNLVARNATNYGLAPYLETTNLWDYYKVSGSNTSGLFGTPAKGYQVLRSTGTGTGKGTGGGNGILTFKGTLAATDQSIAIQKTVDGWNLIGNPYPCGLDVEAFLTANASVLDQSYLRIYVSKIEDITTHGYDPNTTGLKLASGEGFFVKAKAGGGTINFTTAMKSVVPDAFKSGISGYPIIQLTADNGTEKLGTTIQYISGLSRGLDPGKDAGLFNGLESPFNLFTRLVEDNGVDFTIQALPDNNYETMVVPVGLVAGKGATVTFKASATNLPAGYKVVLEDKETNTFTRLDEANSSYTVSLEAAANGTGRFYLHTTEIVSAIDESLMSDVKVVPMPEQDLVRIIGNFDLPAKAMVYDMNGKLVATSMLTSQIENNIQLSYCATGVYLLKVDSGKDVKTVKFVWKRK